MTIAPETPQSASPPATVTFHDYYNSLSKEETCSATASKAVKNPAVDRSRTKIPAVESPPWTDDSQTADHQGHKTTPSSPPPEPTTALRTLLHRKKVRHKPSRPPDKRNHPQAKGAPENLKKPATTKLAKISTVQQLTNAIIFAFAAGGEPCGAFRTPAPQICEVYSPSQEILDPFLSDRNIPASKSSPAASLEVSRSPGPGRYKTGCSPTPTSV